MANVNIAQREKIVTPYGDMTDVAPNGRGSFGEPLIENIDDPHTITANVIKKGKPGADDLLIHVDDGTQIASFSDRVMNVNDPAFGMRYSDAMFGPASAIEIIRKNYGKVPPYAKLSSLYKQTRALLDDQVTKKIEPYQQRAKDLAELQEIQQYVHNKNTYEATMAKCGKNKLPGFVGGTNPFSGNLGLKYNLLNLVDTNRWPQSWGLEDHTSIPGYGIYPETINAINQDNLNDRGPNGRLGTVYRVYDADSYGGRLYKPYDISSRFTPQGKFWDNLKFPTSTLNPNAGTSAPRDFKLPDDFWGDFKNSNNTTPSIFTENPFRGRLGNIYNYTKILNDAPSGSLEDDNNNRNPNARYTGWIPELATQAINLAAFLRHRNSDIMKPDIYSHNPYETAALSRMANLRVNSYPIAKEMRDAERRGAYQIRNAGTSPGQWANQRIALALGTQNNIAKMFANNQMQNNAYQSDWAKSALAAGENTRNARMKANEYGWNQFIAAHGARELNSSKYMDAIAQTLGQGYSNWWKWNQWRDTMSRYDQAYDLENKKLKAYMRNRV